MKVFRIWICLVVWGLFAENLQAQAELPLPRTRPEAPAAPEMESPQFGIRFGYQLQFPSKNYVRAQNYSFFEAGHHLGYGAYINLKADDGV
ncbi:MAG TPA: hypothetical protein VHS96_18865, partial [Bacteroidia bacterium]|nr:hypothetical protein [Bacteroidia bacterium]